MTIATKITILRKRSRENGSSGFGARMTLTGSTALVLTTARVVPLNVRSVL